MPEKTNSSKRHPSIAQTLDRFLERVDDEPEHAAHFAQEIPEDPSDLLERDYWRRDESFFGRVLFLRSHCRREAALVQETEKAFSSRWRTAEARTNCSEAQEIYGRTMFSNLRTGRGRGISSCATVRQGEFNERKQNWISCSRRRRNDGARQDDAGTR